MPADIDARAIERVLGLGDVIGKGPRGSECVAVDALEPGPFSIGFVRVPYDIEAKIRVARDLGLPDVDLYAGELRDGSYRANQPRP